ncbi:hypothetical protein [Longispora albida]|uniref:hypothetical protein n=1 Tax=Longispora albida TaxID=203523 RepID=UPI00039A958E|nr:hypothetical protein [Longispora albida]
MRKNLLSRRIAGVAAGVALAAVAGTAALATESAPAEYGVNGPATGGPVISSSPSANPTGGPVYPPSSSPTWSPQPTGEPSSSPTWSPYPTSPPSPSTQPTWTAGPQPSASATWTAPAPAPAGAFKLTVLPLELKRENGRYDGRLSVTVRNTSNAAHEANVRFTVPRGFRLLGTDPSDICMGAYEQVNCIVPGGVVKAGETRSFAVKVMSYAGYDEATRYAIGGKAELTSGNARAEAAFPIVLRGNAYQLKKYVPASQPDVVVSPVTMTMTRNADGSFAGVAKVTVTYKNDAPNDGAVISIVTPAGIVNAGPATPTGPCMPDCSITGYQPLVAGQTVTYGVKFTAPAGTAAGAKTGEVSLRSHYAGQDLTDLTPADNKAVLTITVP